jgi:hypothetical protein
MLGTDPELKGASYEIWTKGMNPKLLTTGIFDDIGRTITVYTKSAQDIEIIFGHNEWTDVIDLEPTEADLELTRTRNIGAGV